MENRIGRSTASPTSQADEALRRVTTQQSAGDIYIAAARTDHNTHCTRCREISEASDANAAANAESIARRDRHQLGLRLTNSRAVNI